VTIGELPNSGPEGTSDGTNPPPNLAADKTVPDAAADTGNGDPNDAGEANDAGPYFPCAGKTCGQQCSMCAPNDPNCVETGVVKFCHPGGDCKDFPPACVPPPPYQPCAGKACGQSCSICDPTDPNCVETAVLKECSKTGQCSATAVNCN
jgi:hypothetical protein